MKLWVVLTDFNGAGVRVWTWHLLGMFSTIKRFQQAVREEIELIKKFPVETHGNELTNEPIVWQQDNADEFSLVLTTDNVRYIVSAELREVNVPRFPSYGVYEE